MTKNQVSLEIKDFLLKNVHSAEQLEVLLLVHSKPAKEWSAFDISAELGIDPISASNRLMDFQRLGILAHKDGAGRLEHYHYKPTDGVGKIIDEIVRLYSESRLSILNLVGTQRFEELVNLADAFKFKKDG